jgi:hypothetical protein
MLQHIGANYHWLELLLHDQANTIAARGRLQPPLIIEDFAVLHFIAMVMEIHARLDVRGKRALQGCLRSALSAETGFAVLYLEMDIARRLLDAGFDVEFPDLEGNRNMISYFTTVACRAKSNAKVNRPMRPQDLSQRLLQVPRNRGATTPSSC